MPVAVISPQVVMSSGKEPPNLLLTPLHICRGCRVYLTANLCVSAGLVNGAFGTVQHIVYATGRGPPALPLCVIVRFDGYDGPSVTAEPSCLPIFPIKTWGKHKVGGSWTAHLIPLRSGFATIHKSQGQTVPRAIVDLGCREDCRGLTFVALSRVREISYLQLQPFNFSRLQTIADPNLFHSYRN